MRRFLILGLLLTSFIYMLPLVADYTENEGLHKLAQDVINVHAESTQPETVDTNDPMIAVQVEGEVREMRLEDYVAGVVAAEISPDFPEEAIKAQAVAARTYAAYKQAAGRTDMHVDADVCDDYRHCAAYVDLATEATSRWGDDAETYENTILDAVQDTQGQIVSYEGQPIIAVFCAASGEKTEASVDVWGSEVPYLVSVDSPGGEACPNYKGEVTFSLTDFRNKISEVLPAADLTGAPNTWFKASERSAAGGIKTVKLGGIQVTGVDLREVLGLNSTNFTVSCTEDSITFQTIGYGHGVGLSQYGAKYMAEQGATYIEILTHYYTGTELIPWTNAA